jgi:ATP-dependent Zn protease
MMSEAETDFVQANAYHESGHAIVGWALRLLVSEIMIRDDRPGKYAKMDGSAKLSLLDQVAVWNAGRVAEEVFGRLLPSWATDGDREETLKLLATHEIRETPDIEKWIADGRARAKQLLTKYAPEVHRLAARLIECRQMEEGEFERFMKGRER